jgi:predicted MPP superfamily phosphohydrolase
MSMLSWLHLSDWHQRGTDFDRTVVRDRLLVDLRARANIAPELASIRLVIFSGDLAFAGQKKEYEAAQEHLLEPVRSVLGLEPRDFFFVPGNHDIDRGSVAKFAPPALQQPFPTEQVMQEWLTGEQERAALLQPFGSFQAFVASYSGQASPAFASSREIEVAGTRIALLGFNSALMCGRRRSATKPNEVDDYGVLTLGEPQIHELLSRMEGANLRISTVHHPFE